MDAAQWPHQGIGGLVKGVESSERRPQIQQVERRARPQKEQALNCPRCDSTNTKFCYYNNYSLTQPRYFCKTCRRYWTEGGTLRNVPVGGGSRKNKRSSSSSSSSFSPSPSTTPTAPTKTTTTTTTTTPQPSRELDHLAYKFYREAHDLNLSFQNRSLVAGHEFGGAPLSALDLLRSGGISTAALGGSFVPVPMPPPPGSLFGPGFGFPELVRPASSINIGSIQLTNESHEAQAQGDTTLFWNGVMGGSGNRGAAGSW